jgi:DNA-binding XRE family transcriptional regulator
MSERKQGSKQAAETRKGKLTIAERLERGRRDHERWSKKFETNPRLKKIYEEESAKMELWLQLVEARQQAGLTQEELAGRIGVSQSQVAKLERAGYDRYTLETLRRYIQALGADFFLDIAVRRHSAG